MPNYDFIARGLPPIDIASPLMQVEQIRQQRAAQAMQQQRNDLFAAQQKRQDDIFAQEQQDREARQQQEAAQAQARAELPKLEAALATGQLVPYLRSNPQWSQIADAVEQNPEFADRFVQLAYQQAGVEMPKRPMGDPRVVDLGGGIRAVMQGEEMRGSPIVPPAPERPQQYKPELVTRPVGDGNVQDFEYIPGVGMRPVGEPYKEVPGKDKAPSDAQLSSKGYLDRMRAAETLIGEYVPNAKDYFAATQMMSGGPLASVVSNYGVSDPAQSYFQAASDWVRAKLRKESGAVIGPEEMVQEIRTYFPVPGDSPSTVLQKKQARKQAEAQFTTMAGRAADAPTDQEGSDPLGIR